MARPLLPAALGLSGFLILLFCGVGGSTAELGFAVLAVAFPIGLMLLGVVRSDGRVGAAAVPILVLLVVLEACLFGMLLFRGQVETGPWALGLPAAAAIQIYGILLVPLVLVNLGFALSFGSFTVSEDDLERLRAASDRNPGD